MQDPELRNRQSLKSLEKIKIFDADKIVNNFFTFITK